MLKRIKPYMMPIAMTVGAIFYSFFGKLSFLTPFLIFVMLFLTYSNLKLNDMRFKWLHLWLLLIQFGGSLAAFWWHFGVGGAAVRRGQGAAIHGPVGVRASTP